LLHIMTLWRGRAFSLGLGLLISLGAIVAGMALMYGAGSALAGFGLGGGVLAGWGMLRLAGIVRPVLRYSEKLFTHAATFLALADLRIWFFRKLAGSAAGGLGFRRAGDILSRLVSDVEELDGVYLRLLVPLAGALLVIPVVTWLAWQVSGIAALMVAFCFAASALVLPGIAARLTEQGSASLAASRASLRIAVLDALSGIREVRAYGAEGRMLAAAQSREAVLLGAQYRLASRAAWAGSASFLLGQAAIFVLLLYAGAAPIASVAALFVTVVAFEAVAGLPRAGVLAGQQAAAAARVVEAAGMRPAAPDPASPAQPPAIRAGGMRLRFEGIRFAWAADRAPVYDGLTLDIPAGSRIALLGPSGAGKSTLAALALRMAAPLEGRILLGGADIATLAGDDVRARIAWLSQATHLFDDTIRNNLLLGRKEADNAALWAALAGARLDTMVRALPEGLDTFIGEGGSALSGGQARRLALARTLLSAAPVLILDEPAAGLDAETERAFLETLNETTEGRTVVLIAHRLTGVERLDRIYRLTGGHAVAAAG
jgi:ATP-binding cassette subfamily C protein CydC